MAELRSLRRGLPFSRELLGVSAVFAFVLAILVLVGAAGVQVLFTLRAYAAAEGQFAKGHRGAIASLYRYRVARDPSDLVAFRERLAVPMEDVRARRLLAAPHPDRDAARAAFIAGRNHPDDFDAMAAFLPYLERMSGIANAFSSLAATDADLARLASLGEQVAELLAAPAPDAARVDAIFSEVDAIDARLVQGEEGLGREIGIAARQVKRIVIASSVGGAAMLLGLGIYSTARLLRRLRRSESRFRAMIEYAQDVIVLLAPDGRILYASPATERVLGWRPEELVGENIMPLCHRDDRPRVIAAQADAVAHPEGLQSLELRVRHKDGTWRIVSSVGGTWPGGPGGPRTVVSVRDMTEPRATADELARARRLESIGRLAGGIAHDFNNLLTAILGSAALAREQLPAASPVREEINEIVQAGERAASLTQQLLAFARRQVVEPRVFDVHEVIGAMESMLRRLMGTQIELAVDLAPVAAPVRADPGQIEQVLVNLAVNARDAMPDGGRLAIATEVTPASVVIQVSDTGIAMSDEVRDHAFEPFFTTKAGGKGTGLGLATCYGIVTQTGGSISIESTLGIGTRFRVELPIATGAPATLRRDEQEPAATGHELVMVVEDEPVVRRIAVRALRERGHRVLEAGDAETALRLADESPEPIALLVTDVVMRRTGGRQLADRLRRTRPELRVLYVSGFTEDPAVLHAVEHETAAFLQKPFTPSTFARKVREVLDAAKPQSVT